MSDKIYLVQDDDQLVELASEPYDSEDFLQGLLERFPDVLAGNGEGEATWRLLLVEREAGVPDAVDSSPRWSVDHLFVDDKAVPTLVEVKRSQDTRVRREVVGQMLDYAANAVTYWPVESMRSSFERTCGDSGVNPDEQLAAFLKSHDVEAFWLQVKTNLQAGRIRMLFVADEVPLELRRIVEFLNEQMDPAEVLAIEVRQFVGGGLRTLVPSVVGHTAGSDRRKRLGGRQYRQWDEESFFGALKENHPGEVAVARRLYDWALQAMTRIWWGSGTQRGSLIPVLAQDGTDHTVFALWTNGRVEIQFGYMQRRPPFDEVGRRRELATRLNRIEGIDISLTDLDSRFPTFPLAVLTVEGAADRFLEATTWAVTQMRMSGGKNSS